MSEEERKELDELISTKVVDTRFKEELISQGVLNFTHILFHLFLHCIIIIE
ncbi:hypothetical protein V6M85_08175 [Sulfolobus tengchongensis]|uniref:Uncharacterized protein n=1 Tax=Sulfolobus tengchongensis TaxID=207809 RepID=A0AAX4KZ83_9CREN